MENLISTFFAGPFLFLIKCTLSVYLLWGLFLAVMGLKVAKHFNRLSPFAYYAGLPYLAFGYLVDFLCNMVPFTVFMLDLPRELTVTARMKRYVAGPDGWRKTFAKWFAKHYLDPFEMDGSHV